MACILTIETSTSVCSVALAVDGNILFNRENREGAQHAALTGVYVAEALSVAKLQNLSPEAVAVSSGPGSYTGLRIGVSTAKGLCYGLGIPLISISPLKIMTDKLIRSGITSDLFCPMIDARRMEVYTALYDLDLSEVEDVSAKIINEDTYLELLLCKQVVFFGDGSEKCRQLILSQKAVFVPDICPLAAEMIFLAEKAFTEKTFEDVAYFEPFYLKEFVTTIAKNKVLL